MGGLTAFLKGLRGNVDKILPNNDVKTRDLRRKYLWTVLRTRPRVV